MGKAISINIEDNSVKAVYATLKGRRIIVEDEIVLPRDRLDEFLSREKVRDFTVSVDFTNLHQDTVLIPPVKDRLARALIASELRKKKPGGPEAVPAYFKVGKKTVNGKRMDEFVVFSVDAPEIDELVRRFLSRGKRIRALYPNILSFIKILPRGDDPYLCFYEAGSRKNLFLVRNGKVLFVRPIQSLEKGITDHDIQNINMTVSYCVQKFRVKPAYVLVLGEAGQCYTASSLPVVPIASLRKPDDVAADGEAFTHYMIPIAALGAEKAPTVATREYRKFYSISKAVQYATASFVVLSFLMSGALGVTLAHHKALKARLADLRRQNQDLPSLLDSYNRAKEELETKKSLIRFINAMSSSPSAARLMYDLSSLGAEGMDISEWRVSAQEGKGLILEASGQMLSSSLYGAQRGFEGALESLKGMDGTEDAGGAMQLKDKSFSLTASFRREGEP